MTPPQKRLYTPGSITALILILYGFTRFLIEFVGDDNPYEFLSLTISHILGVVMIISGILLLAFLPYFKSDTTPAANSHNIEPTLDKTTIS
ncbi:MAG: prolipoprotein diacylglyceryl transferase [Sedimentisphaerales bacterium]|nr:prolipoprotein diacylglyceryl transferase [Sedimentisphaerales bacterium]